MIDFSCFFLKATPGFEPGVKVLQTLALPLGYVAAPTITNSITIFPNLHHLGENFWNIHFFHELDRRKACPPLEIRELFSLHQQSYPSAQSKMALQQNPKYAHLCRDFGLYRG